MITDSHCHVFDLAFAEDRTAVLERARTAGVGRMIVVGTDHGTSLQALELSADEPGLYATAGVHPHAATSLDFATQGEIAALCRRPDCVAVGETGLDFFKGYGHPEAQRSSFRWHLELAREIDKPVVIHCRDAHDDVVAALRAVPGVRGVMHCYSLTERELEPYLEAGLMISFSGIVTYPANDGNRRAATAVPAESLLVETDCPYLPPQGHRGQRNEPAFVERTLQRIAELREVDPALLAHQTTLNASRLFGLPEE